MFVNPRDFDLFIRFPFRSYIDLKEVFSVRDFHFERLYQIKFKMLQIFGHDFEFAYISIWIDCEILLSFIFSFHNILNYYHRFCRSTIFQG